MLKIIKSKWLGVRFNMYSFCLMFKNTGIHLYLSINHLFNNQVKDVISELNVHQCDEVPTRKIAAFSYFYDRAVDAGILNFGESAVVQVYCRQRIASVQTDKKRKIDCQKIVAFYTQIYIRAMYLRDRYELISIYMTSFMQAFLTLKKELFYTGWSKKKFMM